MALDLLKMKQRNNRIRHRQPGNYVDAVVTLLKRKHWAQVISPGRELRKSLPVYRIEYEANIRTRIGLHIT